MKKYINSLNNWSQNFIETFLYLLLVMVFTEIIIKLTVDEVSEE